MENWFGIGSSASFDPFGTSHIIVLTTFLIVLVAIPLSPNWFKQHPYLYQMTRMTLLMLLLLSEISYQIWTAVNGIWNFSDHMPLHLCGMASLFGMITLITYQPHLIKINFFIGIIPAFIALITPDLPHDFQHFRFWKFFLHHMAIPWTSLFLVVTTSVKIRWSSMFKTYLLLVFYAILMSLVNSILDSNYLYLNHPPSVNTPLNYLGSGIWYPINLGLVALALFVMMFLIYQVSERLANIWKEGA